MLVKLTKGHKGLAINIDAGAHNLPVEALLLLVMLVLVQGQLHVTTRKAALMLQVLDHHLGKQALSLSHLTPACRAVHTPCIPEVLQAGATGDVAFGAAGHWTFSWELQTDWTEVNISTYKQEYLFLLDFFLLVQLYSKQGVSCRNIGQRVDLVSFYFNCV